MKDLETGEWDARRRVRALVMCLTVLLSAVGLPAIFFPRDAHRTFIEPLLPISYSRVDQVHKENINAELSASQFEAVAKSQTALVELESADIRYLTGLGGLSIIYKQPLTRPFWYVGGTTDVRVLNGQAVYVRGRGPHVWILLVVLPLTGVIIVALVLCGEIIESDRCSRCGSWHTRWLFLGCRNPVRQKTAA